MTEGNGPPAALRLRVLGVAVDVAIYGPGADRLLPVAAHAWSRAMRPDGAEALERLAVHVGDDDSPLGVTDRTISGSNLDELMEHLSQRVTLTAITARAGSAILLHAAGLVDPGSGRAIVLVAPSGTGKTTAATRLGRRLGYLSDETVAIEQDLSVTPHAKPLSVVQDGMRHKQQISPDDLGLGPAATGVVHRVLLLERDGIDELRAEEPSLVTSLVELAPQTSYLSQVPEPLHRLADVLQSTGGLLRVRYGDIAQLEPLVDELLGLP